MSITFPISCINSNCTKKRFNHISQSNTGAVKPSYTYIVITWCGRCSLVQKGSAHASQIEVQILAFGQGYSHLRIAMITKVKVLVVKSSETSHLLQPSFTEKVEETLRITTPPPIAGGHGKKSAKKARVWSLRLTTMLGRLVRHSQCLCRGRRREKCILSPIKIFSPTALLSHRISAASCKDTINCPEKAMKISH